MTRIGPIVVAAVTLFVTADALACSCKNSCDDQIAVGDIVPQNVESIGFIPCLETGLGGIELERKTGAGWESVEHEVFEGDVQSVGPVNPWRAGEYYRLSVGSTTRSFSIKSPLDSAEVTVSVDLSEPVVEDVAYAGGPACRRMLKATRYDATLVFDEASTPFRHLFVITQTLDGSPFRHRTSNCSMQKPTHVYTPKDYLIGLKCRNSPDDTVTESAALSYDVELPGLEIAIGVETPPRLVSKCGPDEGEVAAPDAGADSPVPDELSDAGPDSGSTTSPADQQESVEPATETTAADESGAEEEDSGSLAMVIVGLGLFLVISLIVGWKFSAES